MGNRAVITTRDKDIGIYLHWNGGRDSVEAFLKYCNIRGFASPERDCYGWARLCQVIANFFGGSDSIGIDHIRRLDCKNGDNGMYIIENWEIVGRKYFDGIEQRAYDINKMMADIDEAQPEGEQLGEFLKAKPVDVSELKVGDLVCRIRWNGQVEKGRVVGIGKEGWVNGVETLGIPYVGFEGYGDPEKNPNCYLHSKFHAPEVRLIEE